jgi:cytoskeleton protein RodZ
MARALKEIRTLSGLEIADVARATCIAIRYLKAIEEGDYSQMPADIYARGYIKEYARCLGIPYPEAIREYESYLKKKK